MQLRLPSWLAPIPGGTASRHTGAGLSIRIDKRIHSETAVRNACYWFSRIAEASISDAGRRYWVVVLSPCGELKELPETLEGDFRRELLDQELRAQIARETRFVRDAIVSRAFGLDKGRTGSERAP